MTLTIIGGGMAGCEAAWQAAQRGKQVRLYEMRPTIQTDAHITDKLAELVCSNSFRSDDHESNAVGLLHEEMRRAGSLIITTADEHKLPAGGALAVDREKFSEAITNKIESHHNITLVREELTTIPDTPTIIASGPLTSSALAEKIAALTNIDSLAFFDAIAPIVYADSIDMSKAWFQSRYDKGETEAERKAYLNCPMSEEQYNAFIDALLNSPTSEFKEWEKDTPYFNGCLPIEVMAERGRETLRFGPMKPVGLTNPHQPDVKPYAVVQLRQENAYRTLFNIVGFQTKLKYGAQADVLKMIPGLENASFARLGGIHRNTFLNAPKLLDSHLRLKSAPHIQFAGQIIGVEGYVESASMGLLAGRFAAGDTQLPPPTTAHGALLNHVTGGAEADTFQPMNVNFGLFPPCETQTKGKKASRKRSRAQAYCERALSDWDVWINQPALATA